MFMFKALDMNSKNTEKTTHGMASRLLKADRSLI